ncbi:MAG: hypothetical protein IPF99_37715 [Deltaproteobacteria bacterium]|nr:hypothetical protein [Deltaproteobacteria bacterium]
MARAPPGGLPRPRRAVGGARGRRGSTRGGATCRGGACGGLPAAITAEDSFQLEPGFTPRNIARRRGQLLARDRHGEIVAPHDGVVILPLYQGLGATGSLGSR